MPPPLGVESLLATEFMAWRQHLMAQGGERGALDWLLDAVAGLPRARLQALKLHPRSRVNLTRTCKELETLWREHLSTSVPLQYLVGRCYWRNFELEVCPAVLIPRPETEAMIDLGLDLIGMVAEEKALSQVRSDDLLWADLGTGSGCLAMGLAQALPNCRGLAVDVSPAALAQACLNLQTAGFANRVDLIEGDWFAALQPWWGKLQLVLANPPYIPSNEVDRLDVIVRDHEPRLALDGGDDGLACIRSLVLDAPRALAPGGWLLMEHHHDQSDQVLDLLAAHGLVDGQSHLDLEGHRRFASARRCPDQEALISGEQP
ncbi:MAG: peptide chain release factor N(5)-glutamine methyltransferase [Cyanobium sp.]